MHLRGIDASLAYMFWNLWNCNISRVFAKW